jgi:hypothetical protein
MFRFCIPLVTKRYGVTKSHGWLVPVAIALLLAACAEVEPVPQVQIAKGISMPLLLPTQSTSVSQKISASYRRDKHVMIMQVQASPQQIIMAGLAPTGTRLFSLTFDGIRVTSWKSPLFNAPFDGAYVLADYELAAFGAERLRRALPKYVTLEETQDGDVRTRVFKNGLGKTVIDIKYDKNQTRYCHIEREYCLAIENL